MIKEWLNTYQPASQEMALQALREIMQQVALAGLQRAGFFDHAAFYGGTALRIFYGLNRFSEDLDFSLLKPDPEFSLDRYLPAIEAEFAAMGMEVSVKEKQKTNKTAIESAFLKPDTVWRELVLEGVIPGMGLQQKPNIKIKLEIDTKPPGGFTTEEKLLLQPFSFYVKCFTAPDLFAGKMHALLFRKWKNNVKGRDWYDLEWYIKKGIPMRLSHFAKRAFDSEDWLKDSIAENELKELLSQKIDTVSFDQIKTDIRRFIPDPAVLTIWSPQYFHDLMPYLKLE